MQTKIASNRKPPCQEHQWRPVAYVPFDEQTAYRQLDGYFLREAEKRLLNKFARIDDDQLLGDLVDSGFTEETLPALTLLPLTFVAWASDEVTQEEGRAVLQSFADAKLFEFPGAMACVQSWLDVRPDPSLWDLWVAFTRNRLQCMPRDASLRASQRLQWQATQVAVASGGVLGFGKICAAEKRVIERIREAFGFPDQAFSHNRQAI